MFLENRMIYQEVGNFERTTERFVAVDALNLRMADGSLFDQTQLSSPLGTPVQVVDDSTTTLPGQGETLFVRVFVNGQEGFMAEEMLLDVPPVTVPTTRESLDSLRDDIEQSDEALVAQLMEYYQVIDSHLSLVDQRNDNLDYLNRELYNFRRNVNPNYLTSREEDEIRDYNESISWEKAAIAGEYNTIATYYGYIARGLASNLQVEGYRYFENIEGTTTEIMNQRKNVLEGIYRTAAHYAVSAGGMYVEASEHWPYEIHPNPNAPMYALDGGGNPVPPEHPLVFARESYQAAADFSESYLMYSGLTSAEGGVSRLEDTARMYMDNDYDLPYIMLPAYVGARGSISRVITDIEEQIEELERE